MQGSFDVDNLSRYNPTLSSKVACLETRTVKG